MSGVLVGEDIPVVQRSQHFCSERELWLKRRRTRSGAIRVKRFGHCMETYVSVAVVADPHVGGTGLGGTAVPWCAMVTLLLEAPALVFPQTCTAKRILKSLTESEIQLSIYSIFYNHFVSGIKLFIRLN